MPVRSKLSRYGTIRALATRDLFGQGPAYIATWVATTVVVAGVTMALYVAAYRASPQSLPLSAAVWSIAIATFLRLTWRHLTGMITEDIRSGDIALRMRYPLSYIGYIVADHVGRSLPTIAPFLALMAYLVGGWPVIASPWVVPVFLVMVLGSFALSTMLYTCMGLLAFWVEDPDPFLRIVEKIMVIMGGSVVPLALLPDVARRVIEYIPFAAPGLPAQVTSPDFLAHAPRLLAIEFGWVAVFAVVLAVMWRMAERRVEVNGG